MPVRIKASQFAERCYSIVSWRLLFPSVFVNVVLTADFTMYFTNDLLGHAVLCGLHCICLLVGQRMTDGKVDSWDTLSYADCLVLFIDRPLYGEWEGSSVTF
jgi:hypothetical protein